MSQARVPQRTRVSPALVPPGSDLHAVLALILMTAILAVAFWAMIIRPQQQHRQAHQDFVAGLSSGDQIESFSGIRGTVVEVGEDSIRLEIAPGVVVDMAKLAVSSRLDKAEDSVQTKISSVPTDADNQGDEQ